LYDLDMLRNSPDAFGYSLTASLGSDIAGPKSLGRVDSR